MVSCGDHGGERWHDALFVNGVEEGTALPVNSLWMTSDRYTIGKPGNPYTATGRFQGTIDELRIWNRELCPGERTASMNGELLNPAAQTGLYRYYKFNQGTAGANSSGVVTVADASANTTNATLANFAMNNGSSNWISGTPSITGTLSSSNNMMDVMVTSSATKTGTISGSTAVSTCGGLLAKIVPSGGGTALSGSVTTKATIDGSVQTHNGNAYVTRHYDIEPATNPNTATATVTLYFTQDEFDAFNASRGSLGVLPTSPADAVGVGNLRIHQFHGAPTGGNAPANYPTTWGGVGPAQLVLTPSSVTYSNDYNRWEVVVSVTGFSGFFVSSASVPLPIRLTNFSASVREGQYVALRWANASVSYGDAFVLQRSADGVSFTDLTRIEAPTAGDYSFDDKAPLTGKSFYRLRSESLSGETAFSAVRSVEVNRENAVNIYPNPATDYVTIESGTADVTAVLTNLDGRVQARLQLGKKGTLDIRRLPAGMYLVKTSDGRVLKVLKRP